MHSNHQLSIAPTPIPTPTVTSASEYAHRGLDKLEENLPILQQPPEKVTNPLREGRCGEDALLRLGAYLGRESVVSA